MGLSRSSLIRLSAAAAFAPARSLAAVETPRRGGTLRVAMGREFIGADPHGSSSGVDRNLYTSLYNGLVTVDPQLRIVPDLARSWTTPDPRTYVFTLRPDMKFHDGTPCDAAAVKATFDYILDPRNNSQRRPEIVVVDRVEALDALRVRISLKTPFAPFLAIIADRAGYIVSPAARAKYGKDLARNPVGTGPFRFVEWLRDDHLRLRRFENYFQPGLPYLDEIVYRPVTDQSVVLTELRTGNIDFAYTLAVDPKDINLIRGISTLRILEAPGVGFEGFWLNTAAGPMASRAVRAAFSAALDRDLILAIGYSGVGRIGNGPISPSSWAYDPKIPTTKRDLSLAKRMLAESGHSGGISIRMLAESNNPLQAKLTQLAQAQVKEAGIDARIQTLDFASLLRAGERNDFDVMSLGWSGRIDPDGNVEPIFESKGAFNYGRYHNAEVDALISRGREIQVQAERREIYDRLVRTIGEDVAYAFTYFTPTLFVGSSAVRGFPLSPDALMRFKTAWLAR
ncbi:MAG: peptide ABC transporter substrate-binding protein [Candidatus Eremiobacteraeota bacterium]|nr:peptide ABC transporter substrate-binding protein [Candidatus Eremiobacteraeota bacterium]